MNRIPKGTWVEIEQVVLSPAERSPAVPEDTAKTPLILHVSGFLQEDSNTGDTVRIHTVIGRILEGRLLGIRAGYSHSFGDVIPELLTIGTEAEA